MQLSIITINYNNVTGLERTIRSVISHAYKDYEYIIVDGGSTDGSVEIIKNYELRITNGDLPNRTFYWVSEPDKGIYNAMNKGIRQAKGEYLFFLNSGDVIDQDVCMDKIIGSLNGEDIVYYDIRVSDGQQSHDYIKHCPDCVDFKFFMESTLPHQSTFIRKSVFDEYGGYDENMKLCSDWAFFLDAICKRACKYKHINEHFSTYFLDGISSNPANGSLFWDEKKKHIKTQYQMFYSLYEEWNERSVALYRLRHHPVIHCLRKLGVVK